MVGYVNVNAVLGNRRNQAITSQQLDDAVLRPRAIVVRPKDSGIGNVEKETHRINQKSSGNYPLVYFFGYTNPGKNVEWYRVLVKELAQMLERHFCDMESQAAGMVINAIEWIEGKGPIWMLSSLRSEVVLRSGIKQLVRRPEVIGMRSSAICISIRLLMDHRGHKIRSANGSTTSCQPSEGNACEFWPTLGALSFANETDEIILSKLFRYLSPSQGELPSKNLIMGTLAGDDEH
ncbi:protein CLP1-like [Citrus sinensis]|uniref:Protein CLP1-like n=1 Tax=Citrus sinensis TaxID=2711 RepID=A0ACB8K7A6_CITSI|nr:protein CLP1-like [Citrus sinensis]